MVAQYLCRHLNIHHCSCTHTGRELDFLNFLINSNIILHVYPAAKNFSLQSLYMYIIYNGTRLIRPRIIRTAA